MTTTPADLDHWWPAPRPTRTVRATRTPRTRTRDVMIRGATTLPGCTRASVAEARRYVSGLATAWAIPRAQAGDLVQIVSELAANAIDHAPGPRMTVTAALVPGGAIVSVTDGGPARPLRAGTPAADDERGRGLAIVESLADRWGYMVLGPGTRVWARVAIPPGDVQHAPGPACPFS